MADATTFFTMMAALSTSVQTFVEHVIKRRINWLDTATPENLQNERRRQSTIHFVSFLAGSALAFSVGLKPLTYLGVEGGIVANTLIAGLLVSFGGSFFNEVLGAIREFKKAQEGLKKARGT